MRRGFTLIELIVVLAVISSVVLLVSSRPWTNDSSQLRQAETSVAGLLRTARSAAIMKASRARFIVSLDSGSENYLSLIAAVVKNETGQWELVSGPLQLPGAVRVLPASSVPVASGISWPSNAVSNFSGSETMAADGLPQGSYGYLEFTETGNITNGKKVVFSLCSKASATPIFIGFDQVRAFVLRSSGSHTLLREAVSL